MARLKSITRLLGHFAGRRHLHVPSTMTFTPLDPDQIRRDLDLEARGQERGTRNQPPADSQAFDDIESEIVTLIDQARTNATHLYHANLATYGERLNGLDLDSAPGDIDLEARSVLSGFSTELSRGADGVYASRLQLVSVERELKEFQEANRITRAADYPESKLLYWGVLLAMVLVETVLNGLFLGETHNFGYLGGISEALIIALVNVGLGGAVGYGVLRQCWHRNVPRKRLGLLGLLAYVPIILGFNLGVAHYRDALASGFWDGATTTALATLLASPLGVSDIKSWMLLLIGVLFSLVALIDGFRMDDSYPGYGALWRKRLRSFDDYREAKEHRLEELTAMKDEAVEAMRQAKQSLAKDRGEYQSILAARQRHVAAYHDHLRSLEQVANDLLTAYRDANRRARTEPPPKRFSERWRMEMPVPPVFGALDMRKIDAAVERTNAALERRIDEVHAAYDRAVGAFKKIEQLSEEELARGSVQEIVDAA